MYPPSHRRAYTSPSISKDLTPPLNPSEGFVHLSHRKLLALHGPDAAHFLQGIITNNIVSQPTTPNPTSPTESQSPPPSGFYAAFLNAPGRILYDTFIYPASHSRCYRDAWLPDRIKKKYSENDPAFLIEVDESQLGEVKKHLKRYKLRAKVEIFSLPESVQAWSIWSDTGGLQQRGSSLRPESLSDWSNDLGTLNTDAIGCVDPRAPSMGCRLVLDLQMLTQSELKLHIDERCRQNPDLMKLEAYTLHRYANGISEGPYEIPYAAALPHEYNFDVNGGVDFRKGCYVGQELTIRTQHIGVVRKRVLPVRLSSSLDSGRGQHSDDADTQRAPPDASDQSPSVSQGTTAEAPSADIMPLPQASASSSAAGSGPSTQTRRTSKRSAGKLIASLGDVGIAMCRVEMMTDLALTANGEGPSGGAAPQRYKEGDEFYLRWKGGSGGGSEGGEAAGAGGGGPAEDLTRIKAFVPAWMRERITERSSRKSASAKVDQ
ncbi:MAG: ccr4 associated factor [Alyxoria varia]|nr:MAG: ccr4 associated factor [Alyxoria varia]